ncbi:peptidoglycan/xylan/chitin deacetylase (PgdA/CDA1 family) [Actinoplanes campanulatus]|uniref:Peptidoglycan/xylan/chitin deacetylase (PgdA/CDA1 family) n=1 Tax=Actinoplanes campanulatus TaxID=113559 RepID=A0A7W5FDR4_9ACTN|nr:polysaccharide deacetylase family protein [Actinoplanes campanulatus]MBB3094601.1 peptidoglycan/xylan/chitin deacetylase (PgdA/CDA1 family) [Actinoplanes campanulatus]GGN22209.1 lipoprotein [Actinoplanes campanulatus]GID35482.1 lipoprotein [Actinoplanes campanulatus]
MQMHGRFLAAALALTLTACGAGEPGPAPAVTAAGSPPPILEAAPAVEATTAGANAPGSLPPVVRHGPRDVQKVALTFDADMTDAMKARLRNGAVSSYANLRLLALLETRRIPATFFVTGQWAEQYPDVTRRIAGNPRFEIANHSYEHAAFTGDCYNLPRLAPGEMTGDVDKTFTTLHPYGGRQTRYFRFPGLCHDRAALRALAPLGVTVVDGDVVSGDPFARGAAPVIDAVLSQVKPGSIVIMHITEANARFTDDALPAVLAGLRRRGLEPVTLSELLS